MMRWRLGACCNCPSGGTCELCCDPPLPDNLLFSMTGNSGTGCYEAENCNAYNLADYACDYIATPQFLCGDTALIAFPSGITRCTWESALFQACGPVGGATEFYDKAVVTVLHASSPGACQMTANIERWLDSGSGPVFSSVLAGYAATSFCSLPATLDRRDTCCNFLFCDWPATITIKAA